MEKNENGYPVAPRMANENRSATDMRDQGAEMRRNADTDNRRRPCGESQNGINSLPLAYVYAPSQRFCMLYSAEEALKHGTLFEDLYKPMEVYGNE